MNSCYYFTYIFILLQCIHCSHADYHEQRKQPNILLFMVDFDENVINEHKYYPISTNKGILWDLAHNGMSLNMISQSDSSSPTKTTIMKALMKLTKSLPQILQEKGYNTIQIGDWDLNLDINKKIAAEKEIDVENNYFSGFIDFEYKQSQDGRNVFIWRGKKKNIKNHHFILKRLLRCKL
mmetsp:Transcript_39833/g.51346  ORF Transcript_39833/g.51346 Transcript_39833/m.51346 type:complete len:180 (-) Transcript_39833:533-1072(-)